VDVVPNEPDQDSVGAIMIRLDQPLRLVIRCSDAVAARPFIVFVHVHGEDEDGLSLDCLDDSFDAAE